MPVHPITPRRPGPFRQYVSGFSGRQLGAFKRAARFAGLTFDEFADRLDDGQKRCTKCKAWKPADAFGAEAGRWDGKNPKCVECHAKFYAAAHEQVAVDDQRPSGRPGRPRPGDKVQARQAVNRDVKTGRRPHPDTFHCVRCGHKGSDRRHEYHHHMGYAAEHHLDVIPLCTTCHHEEH